MNSPHSIYDDFILFTLQQYDQHKKMYFYTQYYRDQLVQHSSIIHTKAYTLQGNCTVHHRYLCT